MHVIDEIESIYEEIDTPWAKQEFEAKLGGDPAVEAEIQVKRSRNDHAYFLMIFARFEGGINEKVDQLLIDKSQNLRNWSSKRVWQILKKRNDKDRLDFMERIELLTPKGQAYYNLVYHYYSDRNTVAHGGNVASIDMDKVFSDFRRLYKELL